MNQRTNNSKTSLYLVIGLFFIWALTSNLLPVLIPHLKKAASVNTLQASLVDSAYWLAYFLIAIPAGMMMKRFGYKVTIVTGLLMAATGAFLFPLAADSKEFGFFLFALFVVASGMTLLETSANPYIREFGPHATYPQRLNFAQAFNGLGAVVATNFLNHLILSDKLVKTDAELKLMPSAELSAYFTKLFGSVKLPYTIIGFFLIAFALLFLFTRLTSSSHEGKRIVLFNPLKHPQLWRSMVAQFFYVGAQICVSSFFIFYAQTSAGFSLNESNYLLGFLLISFMAGRYFGAYIMKKYAATNLLIWFAGINVLLCFLIIFAGGTTGVAAFIGVEFFMSIMYPTIFSLGIRDMGAKTEIASSYMVMMIVGGALLPPVVGFIADRTGKIELGYLVPLACFAVILFYARKEHGLSKKAAFIIQPGS